MGMGSVGGRLGNMVAPYSTYFVCMTSQLSVFLLLFCYVEDPDNIRLCLNSSLPSGNLFLFSYPSIFEMLLLTLVCST